MDKRILLVEDEQSLAEVIAFNLNADGYSVHVADTGSKAIQMFESMNVDLVILDIMLPEMDGIDVCNSIRLKNQSVPIIMVTAKNATADRIKGLKAGADDYLGKPFDLEELMLRVEKLIARSADVDKSISLDKFSIGNILVDSKSFEAVGEDGEKHQLTNKEVQLLQLLFQHKGQVVSRSKIIDLVWGVNSDISNRVVDNFILSFRKIFESDPRQPKHFHSIRGVGYKLEVE